MQEADVTSITILFFVLVLLAATQDIAVDGWALTLLSRKHIGCDPPAQQPHVDMLFVQYMYLYLQFH